MADSDGADEDDTVTMDLDDETGVDETVAVDDEDGAVTNIQVVAVDDHESVDVCGTAVVKETIDIDDVRFALDDSVDGVVCM